jgi:hypothetical protein
MTASLPPEILGLIFEELGSNRDFQTLFYCALAGKSFVRPALSSLYRLVIFWPFYLKYSLTDGRIHDQSEYFRDDEPETAHQVSWQEGTRLQIHAVSKWALVWNSIIRSSLGATAYPYCLYIRSLDLRNFDLLLNDSHFRSSALDTFFAHEMSPFLKTNEDSTPATEKNTRSRKNMYGRLNLASIVEAVGESIITYVADYTAHDGTMVALEDISGEISTASLQKWASRLSKLKTLTLYDGSVLNRGVADVISKYCPHFDDLTFCFCFRPNIDPDTSAFFSGLRENSLRSFTAISANSIGSETLLALNHHSSSLRVLELHGLTSDAIMNLHLLQGCASLEVLHLQDRDGSLDLKSTQNDVYLQVVAWLVNCTRLQELHLQKLLSAPSILTELCLSNSTRLRKLELTGYSLVNNQDFHKAMAHQTSLEALLLRADAEGAFRDDIDVLVGSILKLTELRELDLYESSEYFRSSEIIRIASYLHKLERFTFSGHDMADAIWPAISRLPHLRSLNIFAITSFSFDGLLNYVSSLQPTNQGLVLSVMCQILEDDLSDHQKREIQERIEAQVNGRFEFVLLRDSRSSDDSDDD